MKMQMLPAEKSPDSLAEEGRVVPMPAEERQRSIREHLEELRGRLLICLAAVVTGAVFSFAWAGRLIEWLKRPAGELLPRLVFLSPTEGILAHLRVAATAGLVLASPIVLCQIWLFVRPGLSDKERRFGALFIGWGSLLFFGGIAFAYWRVLPVALRFLLGFGDETLVPAITISRYLEFVTGLLLALGVVFELPLAVFLLTRLGAVTPRLLLRHWRTALLGMSVAAAMLSPTPDAVNMMLLLTPLLFLYGVSIGVSWLAAPRALRNG